MTTTPATTDQPETPADSEDPPPREPSNVIEALARVMAELPGIGKMTGEQHRARRGQTGGDSERGVQYAYRSIEQITAETQPLLARYGLVFVPRVETPKPADPSVVELLREMAAVVPEARTAVLARLSEILGGPRATEREFTLGDRGTRWTDSYLAVIYRIYGPGGKEDYIDAGPFVAVGRDNSDKGFNKCQPAGTLVRVPVRGTGGRAEYQEVPIESLTPGAVVVTWDRRRSVLAPRGRRILGVAARPYEGQVVSVKGGGRSTRYTPDHHCLVRLPDTLAEGDHVVYLMRRGDQYRIGRCLWRGKAVGGRRGRIGLAWRMWSEDAEAAWILSVHTSSDEAALAEALTSVRFGLPQTSFTGRTDSRRSHRASAFSLDEFWQKVGKNRPQAESCLAFYGRLIDRPLIERLHPRSQVGQLPTLETAAANLLSGMLVAVPRSPTLDERGWQKWPLTWLPVEVWREFYSGLVYSLEVDVDHDYVGDGIVTGNCLTQAYKQCLLQVLCVADPADEGEHQRHLDEGRSTGGGRAPGSGQQAGGQEEPPATFQDWGYADDDEANSMNESLAAILADIPKDLRGPIREWCETHWYVRMNEDGQVIVQPLPVRKADVEEYRALLIKCREVARAEAAEAGPGSTSPDGAQPTVLGETAVRDGEPQPEIEVDEAFSATIGTPVPRGLAEAVRAEVKALTPAKVVAELGARALTAGRTVPENRDSLAIAIVRDRLSTPASETPGAES